MIIIIIIIIMEELIKITGGSKTFLFSSKFQ